MKVVKGSMHRNEFIGKMLKEYEFSLQHIGRVMKQYTALHDLKENLLANDLRIQMDFAENLTCASMDEVHSAYWNATSVTLQPIVVYYRTENGLVQHKNSVFVSDVNSHNATAVLTIIDKLMIDFEHLFQNADIVHY